MKYSTVVLSKTMSENGLDNTKVIGDQLADNITKIKKHEGKNILIFGSPTASLSLLSQGLIDEFLLFVNPVLLVHGIPLFKAITEKTILKLIESKTFSCGVIALHYETKQSVEKKNLITPLVESLSGVIDFPIDFDHKKEMPNNF